MRNDRSRANDLFKSFTNKDRRRGDGGKPRDAVVNHVIFEVMVLSCYHKVFGKPLKIPIRHKRAEPDVSVSDGHIEGPG